MSLEISMKEGVQVFSMTGDLDAALTQSIRPEIQQALAKSAKCHVVDASLLTMVDSSGIGLLVYMFKQAQASGGTLALTSLNGQPAEMIQFLKIDKIIPVHDDVEKAVKALCD